MRILAAVALAVLATGCGPGDTRKLDPAAASEPQPSQGMRETFASCTWGEVVGATASVWSYACGAGYGNVRLVADDALPGFVIESTAADAPGRSVAIRFFDKPDGAPVDAILSAVRAASPGPGSAACVLTPAPAADVGAPARYVFAPQGAARIAYEAALAGDVVPEPPCGPLGISHTGDRTFREIGPGTVAMVEAGSEIQIFDADTLKLKSAHGGDH